jgi:hypothetical protein
MRYDVCLFQADTTGQIMELLFLTILLSHVLASGGQRAKQPQKPGENCYYSTLSGKIVCNTLLKWQATECGFVHCYSVNMKLSVCFIKHLPVQTEVTLHTLLTSAVYGDKQLASRSGNFILCEISLLTHCTKGWTNLDLAHTVINLLLTYLAVRPSRNCGFHYNKCPFFYIISFASTSSISAIVNRSVHLLHISIWALYIPAYLQSV